MVWRNSGERCNRLSPLRAFLIGVSVTPMPMVHHTGRDTTTGRTTTGRIHMTSPAPFVFGLNFGPWWP